MGRSWAVAVLATGLLLASAAAAGAQLRVGPETDLSGPGLGAGPTLSYDSSRGGWLAFWFSDDDDLLDPNPRVISRYINPDLLPKQDSNTQFDVGRPWTAAYDPVAEEHVLTTGGGYGSTASVWRFSPMGVVTGGPWKLEPGSMAPAVALDPRTGGGIVAYITEPEFDEGTTVWAQRLAPAGGPQGAPVRLSQLATGVKVDLHRPAVAFNEARGEFAVAWRERRSGIGAFVGDIVMTRVAASAGGPIGVPAAISDSRTAIVEQGPREIPDGAGAPGLAYDAATGGYLATWLAARGDVLESATQVYGQRLDGELREVGPDDFRISAGPGMVDFNAFPTVAANDGMVVVWRRWIGDEPQVVGRRVTDGPPAEPALLWTNGRDGLGGSPDLAGPASGPLLLGMGVDVAYSWLDQPQVRLVGDGDDPGTARITGSPPGTSSSRTATFTLETGRPDGGLQCRLGEDPWRACQPTHVLSDLGDDRYRLQVRGSGPDRWVQVEPATVEWRVETGPPDTRMTQTPAAKDRHAYFEFVTDEPSTLECRLDDGPWEQCGSSARRGYDFVDVTDGVHRFEARATDYAGHVDPTPATWTWTHDSDPPETWIDDGPSGFTPPPGTFLLRSDEPGVRYECTDADLGSAETWIPCESGVPFPTRGGVLRARAVDAAGNADDTPARWQWRPETTPPRVDFDDSDLGTDLTSPSRDVTIRFSIGNAGAGTTVEECRLDGGAWQRCASPHRMEGLADGAHALEARSTSRAGVVSPVSELRFSVDTRRPVTYILAKPRERTLLRTARIEFGATRAATFTCHVHEVPRPCTSPLVLENVTAGHHTVRVQATGAGGWTEPFGELVIWNVETDPNAPATALGMRAMRAMAAAPPQTLLFNAPDEQMRTNTALFEWDWLDTDDVVGSECTLDGGDWTPCETPWRLEGLSEGAHHFEVRTVNRAGERDPTPVTVDWTVDTITAHVLVQARPNHRTKQDPVTIAFTADRDGATFECRGADDPWQPCTSPYTAAGQPEGAYRLIIRAVNRGVVGPTRTIDWIVDRTPPDTALSSERVSPGITTSRREIDFEVRVLGYTVEELDGEAEPEFYTTQCRLDGGPWGYCSTSPLQNLADGPHVLEARAIDYAGNVDETPARIAWTVDTGAADTFIDGGPAATEEHRTATFALRAQPVGGGFECRIDGGAWRACEATHTLTGVADGSHTLEARATGGGSPDPTPARWLWTVDAEPTPMVLSGPLERTADSTARFGLAADDAAARIECRLDAGAWQTCGSEPAFPGLADGDHTLDVRAVDGGGRTGVLAQPWRWTVDTRVPDTLLVSAPEPLRRWRDAEIAFRSDEAGTRFQCRLDGGAWATCRSPHWIGGLSDATHTVEVRAIDATGNTDATPVSTSWRVDTARPFGQVTSSPLLRFGTKVTAASFTATGNEALSTVECRVDDRPWAPCRDGAAFGGFTEGTHQAEARLVDDAGNVSYTNQLLWSNGRTVDTEILRRPRAAESSTNATFEFSGDRFSFVCSLDGGPWQSCVRPRSYTGLAAGHHVFEVAAVDADGDRDATPARWEWDIYPPPETTITEGPPATTTDGSARFAFSSNQSGSTFLCRLDSADRFTACPNPYTITGLSEGPHTLQVSARGPSGLTDNSPAAWNWTVTPAGAATSTPQVARGAATSTPQVARGAAEAVTRALAGPRWRRVLSGRRPVVVAGAPGVLTIRVRARSRLVAGATLRMTVAGRRHVALRPYRRARPGSRARVQATWRPAAGPRQEWRLATTVRR